MMTPKQKHRWLITTISEYVRDTVSGGVFVECGVKQGTSSRIIASILRREGYLFDTWKGFPHYSLKYDIPVGNKGGRKRRLDKRVKDNTSHYKDCKKELRRHGVLNLCHLIRGDACKTTPRFVKNNDVSVCLLHMDTDLHAPALASLQSFYPCMVDRGVIVFHDYMDTKWPGIARIVNDFVKKHSWGFIDMNKVIELKAAVVVKGDHDLCQRHIEQEWSRQKVSDKNNVQIARIEDDSI